MDENSNDSYHQQMYGVRIRCILFSARIKMYWKYKILIILNRFGWYVSYENEMKEIYEIDLLLKTEKVIMDSGSIESHFHFMECFSIPFYDIRKFPFKWKK